MFRAVFVAILWATVATAVEREPLEAFQQRRAALLERCNDGLILLYGFRSNEGQSGRDPFRQENHFYYLSGWNEPGAAMLLVPAAKGKPAREILFLPERNRLRERWDGPRLDAGDAESAAETGFAETLTISQLPGVVEKEGRRFQRLWRLSAHSLRDDMRTSQPDTEQRLSELAPKLERADLRPVLGAMRRVKSAGEIALLEKAIAATVAAHRAAWERIRPGMAEYEVYASMASELIANGCLRPAYPPILGAGPNSVILHYTRNTGKLRDGDLLLMDVGGEYGHYGADITRTVPVNGVFSPRQREIYDLTLKAQQAVIAAVKPGMRLAGNGSDSLTQIAREVFEDHSKALGPLFPHSVGHYVGLDVHDPGNLREPLEEGMVITVEPGLYLPKEGFGVRIEDMLVVTADGARLLGPRLPSASDEIEALLRPSASSQ